MKAYCMIRDQPWYRRSAFVSGLKAAGYSVMTQQPDRIDPQDVLVIWNRYSGNHDLALRFERAGASVLVAENGYLGQGGGTPKFQVHPAGPQPNHYYALGLRFHNDDGGLPVPAHDRFAKLAVQLKPWRQAGGHILVCPNRSFGVADRIMPTDWAERTAATLKKSTKRPVRIRKHPGNNAPKRPLAEDLFGAWAVYVWSSSCGVHALVEGIPVFVHAPHWIMKGAGAQGHPDEPVLPEREPYFERLAWGQWTCAEIERGEPFAHLLSPAR